MKIIRDKNIAIINNSNNPDMVEYFNLKKKLPNNNIVYCTNINNIDKKDSTYLSSIAPNNKLSFFLLIDTLIATYLILKFISLNVKFILFDNAHISNIPLAIFAKFVGIKLVFTMHDWIPHEGKMNSAMTMYNCFARKFSDHLITFSPVENLQNCTVMNLSGFKSNVNYQNENSSSFLFFGRIEPYKGLGDLLEIAKQLLHSMPDAIITVMGKGLDKNLSDLREMPNVELINRFFTEDELQDKLSNSVAVLCPYISATQSGVVLKSFASGVPVIAYDVGSLSHYIKDDYNGILVPERNIDQFVNAIQVMKKNRASFVRNVINDYDSFYDEEAHIDQYSSFIEDLDNRLDI